MVPVAEILNGASPVNAGHQSVVTETGVFDHFRRTEEKHLIERPLGAKLVDTMKHKRTASQRQHQARARDDRGFLPGLHFISNHDAQRSALLRLTPSWHRTRRKECSAE